VIAAETFHSALRMAIWTVCNHRAEKCINVFVKFPDRACADDALAALVGQLSYVADIGIILFYSSEVQATMAACVKRILSSASL